MQAYCAGNAQAFDALYQRHRVPLYRYVRRQCRAEAADELFQEIWLRIVRSRASYQSTAKFTTYLYTIARRRLIDYYRSQRHPAPAPYDENDYEGDDDNNSSVCAAGPVYAQPENRVSDEQAVDRLIQEIERLPPEQRDAFLLQEEAGLSLAEIAATLEVGVETAKSRLRYAFDKLRKRLVEFA